MMLFLPGDVLSDHIHMRPADREDASSPPFEGGQGGCCYNSRWKIKLNIPLNPPSKGYFASLKLHVDLDFFAEIFVA